MRQMYWVSSYVLSAILDGEPMETLEEDSVFKRMCTSLSQENRAKIDKLITKMSGAENQNAIDIFDAYREWYTDVYAGDIGETVHNRKK